MKGAKANGCYTSDMKGNKICLKRNDSNRFKDVGGTDANASFGKTEQQLANYL